MARKRPTSYVPLSVYYADDEAVMDAGEDAELMFLRMLAYAGRTPTTEGYVPRRVCLTRLGIAARPEVGPETAPETRLERLVESGLVAVEGDGYRIISWLKWNRSVEEMGLERAQDRQRKAALTRRYPETAPETAPEAGPETAPDSAPSSRGQKKKKKTEEDKDSCATAAASTPFDDFWKAYPIKKGKIAARKAWARAVKVAQPADIIAAAEQYARWVTAKMQTDSETRPKYPEGWLNDGRWDDDLEDVKPGSANTQGTYSSPAPPPDMPRNLYPVWARAHFEAHQAGKPGPQDWRSIQAAS